MANHSLAAAELLLVLGVVGWLFYAQSASKKRTVNRQDPQDDQSAKKNTREEI